MSQSRCSLCKKEIWYTFTHNHKKSLPHLEICQPCRIKRSKEEKARLAKSGERR